MSDRIIKLFQPITINNLTVNNRIVMPAMALVFTKDFSFNDRYRAFYMERTRGGVGLMIVGPMVTDRANMPFVLGLFEHKQVAPLADFIREVHRETGTRIGIQLMQQGGYASSKVTGVPSIAPSAVRNRLTGETPHEMTKDDIEEAKRNFARAALRAKEAGADYVELMAAGGYLIGEFLSPLTNHRNDEYGGSIENRVLFGLEVIRAVREALGRDFAMGIRVSGHDFMEGGNTNTESIYFCREAEKAGADAINVTGGWHETNIPQLPGDVPGGVFVYLARAIKEQVKVPVFASNRLGDPFVAERALRSGIDMVCWGRPLIADPELPDKVKTGRLDEIVPCIGCNACFDALIGGTSLCCTMNPRMGRESETVIKEAPVKKKIFVGGAGPAGMEFALTARQRGHDVTLFEKDDKSGGQINLIGSVPGKSGFLGAAESLRSRCKKAGVKLKFKSTLTAKKIEKDQPDVVAVATGALPVSLKLEGSFKNLVNAWDVLNNKVADIGKRVVIIGGGATGCETALYVADLSAPSADDFRFLVFHSAEDYEKLRKLLYYSGREITIIEMMPRMAFNVGASTRWAILKKLRLMGVKMMTDTKVLSLEENGLYIETKTGTREMLPADTVIIAVGAKSLNKLAQEADQSKTEVVTIGDAKEPRKIIDAIRDGFEAGLKV